MTTDYGYDLSGNRTSRVDPGDTTTYTWNASNQMTGVSYATSGDSASYRYDALGRRVQRVHNVVGVGTTTDEWIYDGFDLITTARNGALYQDYVHGPGIDNPWALLDYSGGPLEVYYYHADRLGSVRALTDATQTIAQSYTYTSFGVTTVGTPGGLDQPFRYTAREWDDPSGLYHYRARYYDPETGQFISHDPIYWAGGPNLYGYVGNNAQNFVDPFGFTGSEFGAVLLGGAAVAAAGLLYAFGFISGGWAVIILVVAVVAVVAYLTRETEEQIEKNSDTFEDGRDAIEDALGDDFRDDPGDEPGNPGDEAGGGCGG